jgi:hypothetical protein
VEGEEEEAPWLRQVVLEDKAEEDDARFVWVELPCLSADVLPDFKRMCVSFDLEHMQLARIGRMHVIPPAAQFVGVTIDAKGAMSFLRQ